MLNKKKVGIAIAIVVIILLIVAFFIFKSTGESKLAKIYNKLSQSNEYLFEMKDTSGYEIAIAKKNGQTCIDMNSDNERVTTLVKDDATYVISHSQKEYSIYNSDVAGETVVTDMLGTLKDAEYSKGKEKINDKNYNYEEYSKFSGFMISTNIEPNDEKAKTRFYFNGNSLEYIKTILENEEQELLEVKISSNVPDELFEIPSDYAEREDTIF